MVWEHPVQCLGFGSLGKKEDLATHSHWVSETKRREQGPSQENWLGVSTPRNKHTCLWDLLWELYGPWPGGKVFRLFTLPYQHIPFQPRRKAGRRKLMLSEGDRKHLGQQGRRLKKAAAGCGEHAGSEGKEQGEAWVGGGPQAAGRQ